MPNSPIDLSIVGPLWIFPVVNTLCAPIVFFCFQGVRFDPDLPQTLRLEFAKSNTKVTKPKNNNNNNNNNAVAQAAAAAFLPFGARKLMMITVTVLSCD